MLILGYIGTDFFTYRMMIGSVLTSPATIAVKVEEPDNLTPDRIGQFLDDANKTRIDGKAVDTESGNEGIGKSGRNKGKPDIEIEMTSADEMAKNSHQPRGKAGTSFMQVLLNRTNGTKNGSTGDADYGNEEESVDA